MTQRSTCVLENSVYAILHGTEHSLMKILTNDICG